MMIEKRIFNIKTLVLSVIYGSLPFIFLLIIHSFVGFYIHKESLILGLIISIFNFSLVLWAWSRIFLKKRIALATSVIVIKYALLGIIIYKVVSLKTYEITSFLIGMISIIFMIICYAVIQKNK